LDELGVEVAEKIPTSRKLGADRARELIAGAKKIYIAKGKRLDELDGGTAAEEIVTKMLGSTGNLRSPTIVTGDRVLVGYNEQVYRDVFG
jgi:arsenate reductase-like glutaredoxin family protein